MAGILPDGYTDRLFQIESGGNPSSVTGSNRGLGQFSPDLEGKYGITNWRNPDQQRAAVGQEYAEHLPALTTALGRPPSPGESYLAHQQGLTGASKLLTADPNTPAWQVIRPYYKSDSIAKQAITGNIPRGSPIFGLSADNISAGAFTGLWKNKFETGLSGGSAAPVMTAQAVGQQSAPIGVPLTAASAQAPQQGQQPQGQSSGGESWQPPAGEQSAPLESFLSNPAMAQLMLGQPSSPFAPLLAHPMIAQLMLGQNYNRG